MLKFISYYDQPSSDHFMGHLGCIINTEAIDDIAVARINSAVARINSAGELLATDTNGSLQPDVEIVGLVTKHQRKVISGGATSLSLHDDNLMGETVKDQITGFTGVVTAHARYITGCDQCLVQPPYKKKGGGFVDALWFDISRVQFTGKARLTIETQDTVAGVRYEDPNE